MKKIKRIYLPILLLTMLIVIALLSLIKPEVTLTSTSKKTLPEYVVLTEGENLIKSNGEMEITVRIPDEEGKRGAGRRTRVMTRYVYSHDRDYLPSRYFNLYLDGTIDGNVNSSDFTLESLGDNTYKVVLVAPKAPGKYEVTASSPLQKYEITVVDKISTEEDLYPPLYQYMYIEKNIINSLKSVNISLKNVVLKGNKWEMEYLTEFEKYGNDWDMGKIFKQSVKGNIVIDANTGRVLEDTHFFSDKLP